MAIESLAAACAYPQSDTPVWAHSFLNSLTNIERDLSETKAAVQQAQVAIQQTQVAIQQVQAALGQGLASIDAKLRASMFNSAAVSVCLFVSLICVVHFF